MMHITNLIAVISLLLTMVFGVWYAISSSPSGKKENIVLKRLFYGSALVGIIAFLITAILTL